MNRPLLIAVCDFLVLSILSLGVFDAEETQHQEKVTHQASIHDDIYALMKTSLHEEKLARLKIESELKKKNRTESQLAKDLEKLHQQHLELQSQKNQQGLELANKNKLLSQQSQQIKNKSLKILENQKQIQQLDQKLEQSHQKVLDGEESLRSSQATLKKNQKRLDQTLNQVSSLTQEISKAQSNTRKLHQKVEEKDQLIVNNLSSMKEVLEELSDARARSMAAERNSKKLAEEISAQQNLLQDIHSNLNKMGKNNEKASLQTSQLIERVNESLDQEKTALKIAKDIQQQNTALQKENQVISKTIRHIHATSQELELNMEKLTPLTDNHIYEQYLTSSRKVHFKYKVQRVFGEREKTKTFDAVPLWNEDQAYLILHYTKSIFNLSSFGTEDLISCQAFLESPDGLIALDKIHTLKKDPRVLLIPLPKGNQENSFPISYNPFDSQDALLIDPESAYYGPCHLKIINRQQRNYYHCPNTIKTRLFGNFNAHRGHFVFSRQGHFIGLIVEHEKLLHLHDLSFGESFTFNTIKPNGPYMKSYYQWTERLPQ